MPQYDWKMTLRKAILRGLVSLGLILTVWGVSVLNSGAVPPKYILLVPLGHAVLAAINNWLKNQDSYPIPGEY